MSSSAFIPKASSWRCEPQRKPREFPMMTHQLRSSSFAPRVHAGRDARITRALVAVAKNFGGLYGPDKVRFNGRQARREVDWITAATIGISCDSKLKRMGFILSQLTYAGRHGDARDSLGGEKRFEHPTGSPL
jgi:hypothetical protein